MKKVLVIDDNEQLNKLLTNKLKTSGYSVKQATNGEDALVVFEQFSPDLIITDVLMPDGDGMEFLASVKERHQGMKFKILAISGGGHLNAATYLGWMQTFGADSVLEKPFKLTDLMDQVEGLTDVK